MSEQPENTLAVIDFTPTKVFFENYEELKQSAQEYLEKYQNLIVSEEDNKSGKELFVEVNSRYKALDKARKEFVKNASAPIKEADSRLKELLTLYDEVKIAIRKQTDAHDEKRKEIVKGLLGELLVATWDELNVDTDYRKAVIDDLVALGSLTEKNRLTAKAKRGVEARAQEDKNLQNSVEFRLKDLEVQSYKAGLPVALSKTNVQYFLLADEETYQEKLAELISHEVEREKQAQADRDRIERERLAAEEAKRIAAEKKVEQDRIAAEKKAEQERIAAVQQAEAESERIRNAELLAMQNRHQAEQLAREQELRNEFSATASEFDDEGFYAQSPELDASPQSEESYQMLDIGNTSIIGVGPKGASATVNLSFSVQDHSTIGDIENEIKKALAAGGLGEFIRKIDVELLPF